MIPRRKFISLSVTAAAAASLGAALRTTGFAQQPANNLTSGTTDPLPVYIQSGSKKKGLGLVGNKPGWAEKLMNLQCKWFYTWAGFQPQDTPQGMEFIPMIRSRHAHAEMVGKIRQSFEGRDIKEVLGFNEPDAKKQDDMTVAQALDAWPLLMETGLRLGSPACVHPDKEWMTEFMAGVEARKLRVDFVCVHSYGNPNPDALIKRLEKVQALYERPLWITEFAVGDWQAQSVDENKHNADEVLRFMEKVLPRLDDLDFLERYAWFPALPNNPALGTSTLFDEEGALTRLGECYRDA